MEWSFFQRSGGSLFHAVVTGPGHAKVLCAFGGGQISCRKGRPRRVAQKRSGFGAESAASTKAFERTIGVSDVLQRRIRAFWAPVRARQCEMPLPGVAYNTLSRAAACSRGTRAHEPS